MVQTNYFEMLKPYFFFFFLKDANCEFHSVHSEPVQRNPNDICCTCTGNYPPAWYSVLQSYSSLFLVNALDDWEEQKPKENGWAKKKERERETVCTQTQMPPTCLCFGAPGSPGRLWRTALCILVYYVIPITQREPQCSAAHRLRIQREENTNSPICIQTQVCHSQHVWGRN